MLNACGQAFEQLREWLYDDIISIISFYTRTGLLYWIDSDKLNWKTLSSDPNAIEVLTANMDKSFGSFYQKTLMQLNY